MSFNDLLNKYNGYLTDECRYDPANPNRCDSAKIYIDSLGGFIKDSVNNSKQDTDRKFKPLLEKRIKDQENKNIYPIVNHDFDYNTAIRKEYNPYTLDITNKPTISNLVVSGSNLGKYVDLMISQKYPNENTIAGQSDIFIEDKDRQDIANKYKQLNEVLPYPSFREDYPECRYPTKGEHSSSYFIKSGTCKTKINNKEQCLAKGYQWTPEKSTNNVSNYVKKDSKKGDREEIKEEVAKLPDGVCYKPRFSYIDNSARGLYGYNGIAPSMLNDILNVTPDKLSNILSGYTVDGTGLLPCTEEFTSKQYRYVENSWKNLFIGLAIVGGYIYIKNKFKILYYIIYIISHI